MKGLVTGCIYMEQYVLTQHSESQYKGREYNGCEVLYELCIIHFPLLQYDSDKIINYSYQFNRTSSLINALAPNYINFF